MEAPHADYWVDEKVPELLHIVIKLFAYFELNDERVSTVYCSNTAIPTLAAYLTQIWAASKGREADWSTEDRDRILFDGVEGLIAVGTKYGAWTVQEGQKRFPGYRRLTLACVKRMRNLIEIPASERRVLREFLGGCKNMHHRFNDIADLLDKVDQGRLAWQTFVTVTQLHLQDVAIECLDETGPNI
ncbi:MAG: hypothetical protein GFH27_549283n389 [Chloroflexi bacterium AL-W]|nr:hypothetical protein [Chloroflexi bacterium AL-N1]NOK64489.1 hypothetical protein [Chloroflexi bacterium AL-N10]NOK75731.1 hypothetical protein [Chloroflexi bacterium AL-N5]NOK80510.1 hypothetical protein [Chloroflexi bacterium AL-W]NOK87024.1 hypothetical protein [Chloroflexi bacterium AL-N15]